MTMPGGWSASGQRGGEPVRLGYRSLLAVEVRQQLLQVTRAEHQLELVDLLSDLLHGLQLLEPHQHRVLRGDDLGGVGEVARRRSVFTPQDHVRSRSLLRLDHLVEQRLHLARQDHVLDADAVHAHAERLGARRHLGHQVAVERVATVEQLVERDARDVLACGQLHRQVERVLDVGDRVDHRRRIGRRVLRGEGQAQRDLVTGHQLLALDLELLDAGVEHVRGDARRGVRPERVLARLEQALELALHVLEGALELLDLDLDQLGRRDHRAQLVGQLRRRVGHHVGADVDRGIAGPDAVDARAQELDRLAVAEDHGALERGELDRAVPVARQHRQHRRRRREHDVGDRPRHVCEALTVMPPAPKSVVTGRERAVGHAVADEHRAVIDVDGHGEHLDRGDRGAQLGRQLRQRVGVGNHADAATPPSTFHTRWMPGRRNATARVSRSTMP